MFTPNVNRDDFASLCICAARYCQGRQTYMPSIVIRVVLDNLDKFSDKDLGVLISDCEYQAHMRSYGDPNIDKPMWVAYENKLKEERERRHADC